MAHCSVLESNQKLTDRPSRRIKRSGGHSLVRQLKADWLIFGVLLKMRPAQQAQSTRVTPSSIVSKLYIPERLPSHRVPGTKTIGPVAEQSRERQELIRAARHEILWAPIERAGISAILRPEL